MPTDGDALASLIARSLAPSARRTWLASRGLLSGNLLGVAPESPRLIATLCAALERDLEAFLAELSHDPILLEQLWRGLGRTEALRPSRPRSGYPGRSVALHDIARTLDLRLPESEYTLPEHGLSSLLERAEALRGVRIPVEGSRSHKGRVGDAVERLLTGRKARGKERDHRAAEIKSVPVRGDLVLERVKLGVVSRGSNPLHKCDRILFVFVEQRGRDHFVRDHRCVEFDPDGWRGLWDSGFLVETAAGSPRHKTRGLYLVPQWFRSAGLWPRR